MKQLFLKIVVVLTVLSTVFIACSKDDSSDNESTPSINLQTEKSEYAPYEIVTIKVEENIFSSASLNAKVNNIDVELLTEGNSATFLLPEFENGNYNLTFSSGNKNYDVPIKVAALTNILPSDSYFSEIQQNITTNLSNLNNNIAELQANQGATTGIQALQNDVVFYTNLRNSYIEQYNNLSDSEKEIFAKTIAANKTILDEFNTLNSQLYQSTINLRTIQSVNNYEAQVEVSKLQYVTSVIFTVAHIPAMITLGKIAASPTGWIQAGAVVALGLTFTSYCISLNETITMSENLTNKSLKPFEFISETGEKVFQTGEEIVENVQAKYRSLINSDTVNSTISTIVENYNLLKDKYNNMVNGLPSILKPSYIMSSLKSTYTTTTRTVHNQYIAITNISNPNVTLQKIAQPDGTIKLKANTNATTDQTFTYDVEYTNGNFATNLKKTVNAKVAVNSCDLNEILGTWTVEMYNTCYPNPDGTPAYYDTYTLTLSEGGQYTMQYNDGSTYSGSYYYSYAGNGCQISYSHSWCGPTFYTSSSTYYQNLYSCGCLSVKHTKQ